MLTIQTDPETDLTERYIASLHAQCPRNKRKRECDWAASLYCRHCGRPIPSLRDGAPGEMK